MPAERPVFWHQGLFLQPQHFQLAELSLLSQLAPYQACLAPHFWGVCRMEIRFAGAAVCSVGIAAGTFLFPDGTWVSLPQDAVIAPRTVSEELLAEGRPVTVYAGLRRWQEGVANVTVLEDGMDAAAVTTRFVAPSGAAPAPDLHAGGRPGEVKRLSFLLKLFFEAEVPLLGEYLLLPVARLERTAEGVRLSRDYVPPSLTLASSPLLLGLLHEIRDQLAARCGCLERGRKGRGLQAPEFGSRDFVYLLAQRTASRCRARLSHLLDAREVHPWQAYGVLGEVAAELACFREEAGLPADYAGAVPLPSYDHLDLGSCFATAHDLILRLLDQLAAGPEYTATLAWDGSSFSCDLDPAYLEGRNRFYLVLDTEEEPREAVRSLITVAKLSCRERLPLLISQALPGITLEHLAEPPRQLPRRPTSIFFAVDTRSDQWDLVRKWGNLALSWEQPPEDLAVQVMIVARP